MVDPTTNATGSLALTMYDMPPDLTGQIVPNDPPFPMTFTKPGQNGRLTLTGVVTPATHELQRKAAIEAYPLCVSPLLAADTPSFEHRGLCELLRNTHGSLVAWWRFEPN